MFRICYICLRSNRRLFHVDQELQNFYDELCDFINGSGLIFCPECISSLKRCYQFQKKCRLALKTFKLWKKQKASVRKSINLLYTEMPETRLGLSNRNNFKVHFYQDPDKDTAAPKDISNCSYPHIVTINIPSSKLTINDCEFNENVNNINVINKNVIKDEAMESDVENEQIEICDVKNIVENSDSNIFLDDMQVKNEFDDDLNDDDDINIQLNEEIQSESDESLDEVLSKLTKEKAPTEIEKVDIDINESTEKLNQIKSVKEKRVRNKLKNENTFNRDDFKTLLKKKFKSSGVVKDDNGTVIDLESILKIVDKFSVRYLICVKNLCSGPEPLTPTAIRKLTDIQSRFAKYDSIFSVEYLSEETQVQAEFEKRREYPDYSESEHRCIKCLKPFKCAKLLEYHTKTAHDMSSQFECSLCLTRFKTGNSLARHSRSHTRVYKCKICPHFMTNHRASMNTHYLKHKGVKYSCENCEKVFKSKSTLLAHINRVHATRYICELCACAFSKNCGLNIHKQLKHYGEEFVQSELNKKCDECDVIFINEDVYRKHLTKTHSRDANNVTKRKSKPKNIRCHLCEWVGRSPWCRAEHYRAQHPDDDVTRGHGGNVFLCHDCGKGFKNRTNYKTHMNRHSGAKPYACPKCPKSFFASRNLKIHLERHSPPSHECSECGKMFSTKTARNNHMRIHIGDRRYKCDICNKGFLFSTALKEHKNAVHLNIKRKKKLISNE